MPGSTGVSPHAYLDSCASTQGQALIGPAWVTCPARTQSGESWVARSGSGAALEMGAWSGPSEPQELDHPRSGCGTERQHPGAHRTQEESEPPGRERIIPAMAAKHCPRCSATPCRGGLLLPPKSYRGVQSLSMMSGEG